MKVVWISHTGSMGAGAEMVLWEAVRALQETSVKLHLILPEPGELAQHLESMGVPFTIVPFGWWISKDFQPKLHYGLQLARKNTLPGIKPLRQALASIRPDLVVSNTVAGAAGAAAAKLSGIPHVWYIHELIGVEGHHIYFDLGTALSLALLDRLSRLVIANSQTTFASFRQWLPAAKMRTVYCAVDVPDLPRTSATETHSPLRLVIVSRIAPGKRQEDAVRAVGQLAGQGRAVTLTLVGREDAAYADGLRELVRELQLERHVTFAGYTPNPFTHLAAADVAITCSRGETFGRVTVEAMKLGLPVVGADSAGTAEIIRDGENGLLYRLGDPGDLAAQISRLAQDRSLRSKLGDNAYRWAHATFNMERYATDLLQVFGAAVTGRSVGHT